MRQSGSSVAPADYRTGDLFINGALLPSLGRSRGPVLCPVTRRTIAASRWGLRYANPIGGAVTQCLCALSAREFAVISGLMLSGGADVAETVFFGQRIEAAEAFRYRRKLVFSAWILLEGNGEAQVEIHAATPREPDVFYGQEENCQIQRATVSRGAWARLEFSLDARELPATGLAVELAFAPELFSGTICLAQLSLAARELPAVAPRPAALETLLAERYFQRHDSSRLNSLGRALVVNAHELHFQFTFPEMRTFPACTLPHAEEGLRVFHLEGLPQTGFRYDITYRSRGSVMIRATKKNHGLADGFLSFVGESAAILLDAEL